MVQWSNRKQALLLTRGWASRGRNEGPVDKLGKFRWRHRLCFGSGWGVKCHWPRFSPEKKHVFMLCLYILNVYTAMVFYLWWGHKLVFVPLKFALDEIGIDGGDVDPSIRARNYSGLTTVTKVSVWPLAVDVSECSWPVVVDWFGIDDGSPPSLKGISPTHGGNPTKNQLIFVL